jgi:hypothetical protein
MTDTGGDNVTYYQVECDINSSGIWVPLTNEAMGLFTSFNHTQNTPFPSGANILYRICPKNGVGFGAYSNTLVVLADSVPTYMNQPVVNQVLNVAPNWIYLTWSGITLDSDTGRDPVIYYELSWFNYLLGTWQILNNETSVMLYSYNFTLSNGIFPSGSGQIFRLRAMNGVGLGAYSANSTVIADSVPIYAPTPVAIDITPK